MRISQKQKKTAGSVWNDTVRKKMVERKLGRKFLSGLHGGEKNGNKRCFSQRRQRFGYRFLVRSRHVFIDRIEKEEGRI